MSDFTRTPNLALYKPTPLADIDAWGAHLNWNADTLDSTVHGMLPLGGGALTGPVSLVTNPVFSTTWTQSFYTNTTATGSTTATGQPQWNLFLTTDHVHAGSVNTIANVANYYGGVHTTGSRIAEQVSLGIGPTDDPPGNTNNHQALNAGVTVAGNLGGNSTTYGGNVWGSNITAIVNAAGTYMFSATALEVDIACQAGSSLAYKTGFCSVLQGGDAVEASHPSVAIGVGLAADSPASPGWARGLQFGGPNGWWPMNPTTGIMIYADPAALGGGPAYTCASGIDLSAVTFSNSAFKSMGFHVDGAGHVFPLLTSAANDAAAATAGVPIGAMYRTGNAVQVRLV